MSSPAVRKVMDAHLLANAGGIALHDLSDFVSIDDLPSNAAGVTLLVQYVGGSDEMVDIGGEHNQGWEERGTVALHYLIPAGFDYRPYLLKMDSLRGALRGARLGDGVVIESISPFSDQISNALRLDGSWHGWVAYASYYRYVCG